MLKGIFIRISLLFPIFTLTLRAVYNMISRNCQFFYDGLECYESILRGVQPEFSCTVEGDLSL